MLAILGLTALVHPLEVPAVIAGRDIWVMLGVTALLLVFAGTYGTSLVLRSTDEARLAGAFTRVFAAADAVGGKPVEESPVG